MSKSVKWNKYFRRYLNIFCLKKITFPNQPSQINAFIKIPLHLIYLDPFILYYQSVFPENLPFLLDPYAIRLITINSLVIHSHSSLFLLRFCMFWVCFVICLFWANQIIFWISRNVMLKIRSCFKKFGIMHLLRTRKFSKNSHFFPLIRKRKRACPGVRNFSFSENFAYVLNGWSHILLPFDFIIRKSL